jgi:hypothetical protein
MGDGPLRHREALALHEIDKTSGMTVNSVAGDLGGLFDWKVGRLRAAQDLPGFLLAWHIILIVAQPGRKRDPDASAGEPHGTDR